MFITMFNIFGKFDKSLNIFFIDVGQGDSTLIITENNKNILIDSGGTEFGEDKIGKNTLLPYLYNRRIYKLDYVMIGEALDEIIDKLITEDQIQKLSEL